MKYLLAIAALLAATSTASADSCWTHNGSLMRLRAYGNNRSMVYEVPRAGLLDFGIAPGTELFNGTTDGFTYAATAVFFTPYDQHINFYAIATNPYYVSGPVLGNRIVLYGQTGRRDLDTLVFDYSYQC